MSEAVDRTALETLESLEFRIQRVGFFLGGSDEVEEVSQHMTSQEKDHSVHSRLSNLESNLNRLISRSAVVRELLQLYAAHPDLFQPSTSDVPSTLPPAELLAIIKSCATSYPTTASRLNAIKDLPIPSAEASASLIALQPRLTGVEQMQEVHAKEMAELRARSAVAVQRWYELGVLGEGECWTEWEGRIINVEKTVRRQESLRTQEAKENEAYR